MATASAEDALASVSSSDNNASDATIVDNKGRPLTSDTDMLQNDIPSVYLDSDWAQSAFLVSDSYMENSTDATNRYWTPANNAFIDTRLGGSLGINARPQFTPYSDIRSKGRIKDRNDVTLDYVGGNYGEGRYYYEAIESNAQTVYMRMGVPQFNSLTKFFSNAFDANAASLVKTGRGLNSWYTLGKVVGTVVSFTAFPALSMTLLAGRMLTTFFSRPTSKFYRLKPTMHLYWSAVNTLVNTIAINKGLMPRFLMDETADQSIGNPYKLDNGFMENLHNLMPDIITSSNGFDTFAIANKAQRMANKLFKADYDRLNNGSPTDYTGFIQKSNQAPVSHPPGEHSLVNFIRDHLMFGYYTRDEGSDPRLELDPKVDPDTGEEVTKPADGFLNYFDAELQEGSQFAIFKVDHTGTVSESFSNAVVESDLSNKFNSTSSQVREARFSFADGNMTGTALEDMVKGAMGAVSDVVSGALSSVGMDGMFAALKGLAGNGFLDIPKHWQSSSVSLPHISYSMQLISPYGNAVSEMQNIFIPLSMIMATVMPLSAGKQAYNSPFLVQLYDRGRCQTQLGIVDQLSISRGTCNLPFTNRGKVKAIDVNFSVIDLSSIMHMPISTGSLFGMNSTLDEDNILMDYLAVLAGQDIYSQIYAMPKAKLNLAKKIRDFQKLQSPAYWASLINEETPTGLITWMLPGAATLPRD